MMSEMKDDNDLPLFGEWQTEEYQPPIAVDGKARGISSSFCFGVYVCELEKSLNRAPLFPSGSPQRLRQRLPVQTMHVACRLRPPAAAQPAPGGQETGHRRGACCHRLRLPRRIFARCVRRGREEGGAVRRRHLDLMSHNLAAASMLMSKMCVYREGRKAKGVNTILLVCY